MSVLSIITSSAANLLSSIFSGGDGRDVTFDPSRLTIEQVNETYQILTEIGLPSELALIVLDYAEYWVHEQHTRTADLIANASIGNSIHECASLYTHTTPLGATLASIPALKMRRVVFRIKSRDQGWSDNVEDHGTYQGSHTWFEAVIFKEDEAFEGDVRREPLEGLLVSGMVGNMPRYQMSNNTPLFLVGQSPEQMMRIVKRNGYDCRRNGDQLSWLLQRNKCASITSVQHTVEWSLDQTTTTRQNPLHSPDWPEDGAGDGKDFVASLEKGDRIGIWARAMYPSWQNIVESAEITVYYAI